MPGTGFGRASPVMFGRKSTCVYDQENQKEFLRIEKDRVHQIDPGLEEFSHLYPGYPYQFVGSL